MKRKLLPGRRWTLLLASCFVVLFSSSVQAQHAKFWVGGSGAWSDAAHWSLTANGAGGAGVPHNNEPVSITSPGADVQVLIDADAYAANFIIDASQGTVTLAGTGRVLHVGGDLRLKGSVHWTFDGGVELEKDGGASEIDTRGIPLASDLSVLGTGNWSVRTDLVLNDDRTITLREGTVFTNGNMVRAGSLAFESRRAKRFVASSSVVLLANGIAAHAPNGVVDAGGSYLIVGGVPAAWGAVATAAPNDQRAVNICGTSAGQTIFTIDAHLVSNYNGFGVSCHGVCNGTVTVTKTGGVGPWTYTWIGGPSGPTAATWNNVCAGNQIVIVTDQGQSVSCATTVQVTDPALLSVIFFGNQPPTCAGVCNGTSNAFAVGGVPVYNYSWNSGAGTGSSFNQLCPGANTLHVTDANNCAFDTTFNFPVLPITPNLVVTNANCSGSCDGTAVANPTGGTGAFTYNWQPGIPTGDGTHAVSQLCAGAYTVTIADANGCDTTVSFTITAPPPIVPHPTQTNATCSDVCNGTATVAPTGAVGPYQFTWSPAPGAGQGTGVVTGLCAGVYTCTVRDVPSGCDTVVTFTITAPTPIDPHATSTNALCANSCDGTATVAPTGGTPGYTYLWSPVPPVGQGTPSAAQLCAGNWSVTITDVALCDTTVQFTITAPPPIVPSSTQTNVTCAGACDGIAGVAPTGGTGVFGFVWSPVPPAGQGTATASQLCAGSWSVTITDANACDTTVQFTITEPPPLVVVPSQTNVTCGSNCDGTATATVTGGTGTITYVWTPAPTGGQGTATATGLCAGAYSVLITDANGCTLTQVFTILAPVLMHPALVQTPASCPGVCDATASVTVTGGVPGYTYLWSPTPGAGQGTASATGLCAQAYSLTVTDLVGCDTTINFTITAPLPILPNEVVTPATCAGTCNGSVVLAPTGGSGTYTYLWTPVPANGQGTATATGLCAGNYQVVITSGACDTTVTFVITAPPPIVAAVVVTPATCAGTCNGTATANVSGGTPNYTYIWAPAPGAGQGTDAATALCAGNYTLTIADAAGCDTVITFTITAPAPIAPNLVITNASCGGACDGTITASPTGGTPGFTYLWTPTPATGQGTSSATGLCPGPGTLLITDAAGCDTLVPFTITAPVPLSVTQLVSPASCANVCDGSISLVVSGGVPGYTYTWTPTPTGGQGTANVSGLCPGDWTVLIADQGGCDTTLTITIGAPPPILPNGVSTNESCNGPCDGTASVSPTGGSGTGYSFLWTPSPSVGQGTNSVSGLCAGNYSVTITDSNGCDTTWAFTVAPQIPVDASVAVVNGLCWNVCAGEAIVTATGGVGTYTYTWTPAPPVGQGTDHASGLCAGSYSVTVADALGCDTTIAFDISMPPAIVPNLTLADETCAGACSGTASAAPAGGTGAFTFDWQPAPATGQGTNAVTGLCAGVNYTLTIGDANGCDTTVAFTVQPFVPIDPHVTVTPSTCASSCDGTATSAPTGGIGPYSYSWDPVPANGNGLPLATGLCAGTYELTVTDASGCDTVMNVVITEPLPIDPAATVQQITCPGACNGDIQLNVVGGNGGFLYTWTPAPPTGQGTDHVSGLCAGTWSVAISDVNGCDTLASFIIVDPVPLANTADVVPSHCQVCDGSVLIHVTGGTAPYTFAWGAPLNITTADSSQIALCAGNYPVTITDAAGCSISRVFAIADADGEVLTMTDGNTTCPNLCDGSVSVAFTCVTGPCTIAWFDLTGNDLAQSGNALSNLCAGSYIAEITNGSGCLSIDTATVIAPVGISGAISSTPVTCAGRCDGTATIGLSGGVGPFVVTWTPAPTTGQGTTHVTGLCPGVYDIAVDDLGGCDTVFSVLITAPPPITVDPTVTNVTCSGLCNGTITLVAQGGTGTITYLWNPVPPNGQGTATATGLCGGTYGVIVGDANGCDTTLSFTIIDPLPLALAPTTTPSSCAVCNGTASVVVSGGSGTVNVQWTQGATVVGTGTVLTGLCAGLYTATATDSSGCTTSVVLAITDSNGEVLTMTDGQTLCANSCDAQVSVSFNCSAVPCTITWYDAGANILAQNQFAINGLCTGSYIVQVTNGAGCSTIDTAFVTPSQTILPNLSSTPVTCNGLCDGTATVGPVGGVDPYTFNWTPAPGAGQGTSQATGLCAGVYEVLIADASGCDTLVSVLITEPAAIVVNASVNMVTCNGQCDGDITLSPTGGNGSFTYMWSPVPAIGQGTAAISGLCAGDWTVVVADPNGCDTTITYTITEPALLALATSATLSACNVCSGTTSVQPSGGTAPYSYSWTQGASIFGTDSALTGLCAGIYTITVTDAHNCTAQAQVAVNDAGGEVVSITDDVVTCPGSCDGEVVASFVCGVPACTVAWFDAGGTDLGQPSNILSNLCAGTYYVEVTNGLGCTTIDTAHVTEPAPIQANLSTTPVSCPGQCNGTATVAPTGGSGTYTYAWTPEPATGQGTSSVTGLCAGTAQVTISDTSGCSIVQDVLILTPPPIDAVAVVGPITCNGACDGSITVTASGGNGGFSYSWSPEPGTGQNTSTVTGLCAGDWSVTVTDMGGCDTTFIITVTDPPVLVVDVTHTDNGCFATCTATAHVDASGGNGPYSISWTDANDVVFAQDTVDVGGLCAGDYSVTVTDASGCEHSADFTIGQGAPISAGLTFLGETCQGPCDGTAELSPSGGSGGGFTILWQPEPTNGQGTTSVSGLCAGDWTVTLTDGAGCDTTITFTILPFSPIIPNGTATQVNCNAACNGSIALAPAGGVGAYTYTWTPEPDAGQGTATVSQLCAGDWTVTIADAVGCDTTVTFTITEPTTIDVVVDQVTDASCSSASDGAIAITVSGGVPNYGISWSGPGGFASAAEDITDLAPGTYTVTVTDANGCQVTEEVTVDALSSVTADAGDDQNECSGASITLDGSDSQGAGSYQWRDDQGTVIGSSAILPLGSLPAGTYTFTLTVSAGPCSDSDDVTVIVLSAPVADAGADQTLISEGQVVLGGQPSGPVGSTFSWSPDTLMTVPTAPNPTATVHNTTWFVLTVVSPDGCTAIDSVLITVVPEITFPSGFTPNGDGHNDTWQIDLIDLFPECEVEVYSRWGELLFRSVGYNTPWDGRYSGGFVPVGTYYYVIKLNDPRFPDAFTGPLTVIR